MRTMIVRSYAALIIASVYLMACQSLSSVPRHIASMVNQWSPTTAIQYRGAHKTYVTRRYGHIQRLITFLTPIQHIVVISMENRTVDDLFASRFSDSFPAGGTWGQALNLHDPNTAPVLQPVSLSAHFDPNHGHDKGWLVEMQGLWGQQTFGCNGQCPPQKTALAYVPSTETDIYKQLVTNWAFASNVLQSNEGPSFVAHQYYIAGQSGGLSGGFAPFGEAENPRNTPGPEPTGDYQETSNEQVDIQTGGCNYTAGTYIQTVNMVSPVPLPTSSPYDNGPTELPCADYNTILDEATGSLGTPPFLDWQYIAHSDQSIWSAPIGVQHIYNAYVAAQTGGGLAQFPFAVDPDAVNFVRNIENNPSPAPSPVRPFAALTYITPCENESDHPIPMGTDDGPQWLAWVINAIGESKYWNSTVIFVTWDDWGGWYDKVPDVVQNGPHRALPNLYGDNPADPNEWGFRVPLIIISPYVKSRGFISNQTTSTFQFRSQGVILQYIEQTFGLASLGGDDYQQHQTDGLQDVFNYSPQPYPLGYVPIPTTFSPPPLGRCP